MQVTIEVKDPLLVDVIKKMVERSNAGIIKYKSSLAEEDKPIIEYVKLLQAELMDAVLYLQKAKEVYSNDLMDAAIRRIEANEEA